MRHRSEPGTYCWYRQKHLHKSFLAKDRMLNELIRKSDESSATLFEEASDVGGKMCPIDYVFVRITMK